ncbi:MAG: sensor domain-containing diguanylate cyclase [Actinomycetota bacterium]|nr:sensor domain-containing diguanylate cyclase [Actinomycetota bacterium]
MTLLLVLACTVWALSRRQERLERETALSAGRRQTQNEPDKVNPELVDLKFHLDSAARDKMKSLVKRNHELLALYSLANVVGSSLELSEVLAVALEGVIRIFAAQAGEIGIIGEPKETLVRFYRADAVLTEHRGVEAPHLNRRLAAEAVKTGLPVIAKVGLDQDRPSVEIAPAKGIAQLAAFPIRAKSHALGVITLALAPDHPIVSRTDQELLTSVGSMIGAAIENSQLYQRLKRISDTDPITGLYNHRFILKRLNAELRRASRYGHTLSVMMLDVDGFKDLNDTFGHPFGDAALKKIALATVAACRETDFVGRYGGDEFLLVLPETRTEAALLISERVRTYVQNLSLTPVEREKDIRVGVTASLGLAAYPTAGKTGTELIIAADKNLYASKRAARNRMNGRQTA